MPFDLRDAVFAQSIRPERRRTSSFESIASILRRAEKIDDEFFRFARDRRVRRKGQSRLVIHDFVIGADQRFLVERRFAVEHLVENDADRPPIDFASINGEFALRFQNLRTDVIGRADRRVRANLSFLNATTKLLARLSFRPPTSSNFTQVPKSANFKCPRGSKSMLSGLTSLFDSNERREVKLKVTYR